MATKSVKYVISMQDRMSRKMGKLSKMTTGLNSSMTRLAGTLGLTFGAGMLARNIFKTIAGFSKKMAEVRAITKATNEEFELLNQKAIEMGTKTIFTGAEAAEGMTMLARAGFNTNQIMASIGDTLNLAAAGNLDLATASDIASDVLTAFGMKASQLNIITDQMAKTATTANTTVQMMGDSLRYVAPAASAAGAKLEEVNAMIGILGSAGVKASMAGTQLRMVYAQLMSGKTQKKLDKYEISVRDTNKNIKDMATLIEEMKRKGLTPEDMMKVFDVRAGTSMQILFKKGAEGLREYTEQVKDSKGEAERLAREMTNNVSDQLRLLNSAWEGLIATIDSGDGVISNTTKSMINNLKTFLSRVTEAQRSVDSLARMSAKEGFNDLIQASKDLKGEDVFGFYISKVQELEGLNNSLVKSLKKWEDKAIIPFVTSTDRQREIKGERKAHKELIQRNNIWINQLTEAVRLRKAFNIESEEALKKEDKIAPGSGVGGGGSDGAMTKITGVTPKVFNINIENLIDDFNINTKTFNEAPESAKEQILIALTQALNEAQTIAQ